ncbi:MAG: hypothetical protein GOV02_00490, partial [Candidatus Aenigmarchaeota archaeon]|nr:hypothetical protein [Candidatus Aenigmarchaeota archaeon]
MFGDLKHIELDFAEGHCLRDLYSTSELPQTNIKHHINLLLQTESGTLYKIYVNNGTLKTTIENTQKNCEAAYKDNPELFPRTELVADGVTLKDGKRYELMILEQDFVPEAENGTLDHYLKDGWNAEAVSTVLSKYDTLNSKETVTEKIPKIRTLDGFLSHEMKWEKRWNLPIIPFAIERLRREGEDYLGKLELKKIKIPASTKLSRVTREFAPRNLLVDGDMLTFDTELYGLGRMEMDLGVMVSQLLNEDKEQAEEFINVIIDRYGHKVAENSMIEFMGYRASSLL